MRGVLRCADGPPESTAGPVFPSVGHRLFRRVVLRAGDRVAGGRFAESAVVSGPGRDRGVLRRTTRRCRARGGFRSTWRRTCRFSSEVTWVLERLADAGLVRGKTVGIDATTLEANAAMRSIERRDTGESYEAFVRSLAEASAGWRHRRGRIWLGSTGLCFPEEQEDVEQGVVLRIAAGPGREDREDEGRSDARWPTRHRARGRHGHGTPSSR